MESKLNFLLDRAQPFGDEKAQLLDELTLAIKNNTSNVDNISHRVNRPMKFGES